MKTLTEHITEYQDHTEDSGATNKARGIRRMNARQRQILASKNYWFLKKESTISTVAGTKSYNLPLTCLKVISVKVTVNGVDYILKEEPSDKIFDQYDNQGSTVRSDFPYLYNVRAGKLLLFPTPSTSSNTITVLHTKKLRDMSLENYTTGTITATNNSATVTGSGTTWSSTTMLPGCFIFIRSVPYEVLTVNSTTSITLARPYEGTTGAGLSYVLGDVSSIPEEFEDMVWIGAVSDYYLKRNDREKDNYKGEYLELEARLRTFGENNTTTNFFYRRKAAYRNPNDYPQNLTS